MRCLPRTLCYWRGLRLLRPLPALPSPPISHTSFIPRASFPSCPPPPPPPPPPPSPIRWFASPPGGPTSSVIAVKNDTEYLSALNLAQENNGLAIVYFTAKWCGPCKMVSPVVDELSSQYDKATFLKVDIDEEKLLEVVSDEKITSVPTFRFFRGGKSIGEIVGANVQALKEKLAGAFKK